MIVEVWRGSTAEGHNKKFSWGNSPIDRINTSHKTLHEIQRELISLCMRTHRKFKVLSLSGNEVMSISYNERENDCAVTTKPLGRKLYADEEKQRIHKVKRTPNNLDEKQSETNRASHTVERQLSGWAYKYGIERDEVDKIVDEYRKKYGAVQHTVNRSSGRISITYFD
jgi:hypothetical protein